MTVLDLSRRSPFHKEKRGRAYEFPLEAIDRRGGRPPAKRSGDDRSDVGDGDASDAQQQLDAVADGSGGRGDEAVAAGDGQSGYVEESSDAESTERSAGEDEGDPTAHVEDAIRSLQALEAEL